MLLRPLSKDLQKKSEQDLNEVPERILEDLEYIEGWLEKQPHLNVRKDRQWLLGFLRNCKFSLERTKEKLDFFYTMKSITPEYFSKKDPLLPEIQEILKNEFVVPVHKTTEEAGVATIMMVIWKNANPAKMAFTDLFKIALMYMDVLLNEDDNCTVNGLYIVHDMRGFSLSYVTHLTPTLCKKAMLSLQNSYPFRIKGIYFTYVPGIYETFINMFKPFLNEKMRSRLKLFGEGTPVKMYEEIPREVFPKDYGGKGESVQELNAEWMKKMEDYRGWFLEDVQYCSDETKRPGNPKTSADIFGVEGSFRVLNID